MQFRAFERQIHQADTSGIAVPHGADKYLFNALMHAAAVAIRPVNLSEEAQCC